MDMLLELAEQPLWIVLGILAVLIVVAARAGWLGLRVSTYAYERVDMFLSPAERRAFFWLTRRVGRNGFVAPKVRVADLIRIRMRAGSQKTWWRVFSQLAQKHVDFVVLDQQGEAAFAVEVDDSSHDRPERRVRDELINDVFGQARIPLVRVKPNRLQESRLLERAIENLGQQKKVA